MIEVPCSHVLIDKDARPHRRHRRQGHAPPPPPLQPHARAGQAPAQGRRRRRPRAYRLHRGTHAQPRRIDTSTPLHSSPTHLLGGLSRRMKAGIGRSFYPFLCSAQRRGTARPPFKPCVRISRTRLSGGFSDRGITRSPVARRAAPGNGRSRAGGEGRGCERTRGSSARTHPDEDSGPCASRAGRGASATRRCRAD